MGGRPGDGDGDLGQDGREDRRKEGGPEGYRAYLRFVHLGTQIALTIVLGVFGGLWLDRVAGSSPAFTVAGSLLGIVFGLGAVILEVGKGRK